MTPMVTLHHFTDPLWLVDRGGWENDETPALFARFVRRVVAALKDYVSLWITINEPNVYMMGGWVEGDFPPGKHDLKLAAKVTSTWCAGTPPPTASSTSCSLKPRWASPPTTAAWYPRIPGRHSINYRCSLQPDLQPRFQ